MLKVKAIMFGLLTAGSVITFAQAPFPVVGTTYQLDRARFPHQAREALRATRPRQDAQADLRQADTAGVPAGDAKIAGHGDLEASAYRMPVQGRNDELRSLLEAHERLVRMQAEIVLETRGHAG